MTARAHNIYGQSKHYTFLFQNLFYLCKLTEEKYFNGNEQLSKGNGKLFRPTVPLENKLI